MEHGYFDNDSREYVIERVDVPVSWTNYLGVEDFVSVVNHTAGGYSFYKQAEHHRITRFRPNGSPLDRPGYYVYLRDDDTNEYWSISWQPVGKPLDTASYRCRHGLSYSIYDCDYNDISASQKLFVPLGDDLQLWDINLKNNSGERRNLSIFSYLEFSFHHIDMDNKNFQMSLYSSGSSYKDGIIELDLFYEQDAFQFFTSSEKPDSYDCVRDSFLGVYNTETNPKAVESGVCSNSSELGGNHCGALHKKVTLEPGEDFRIIYMLGEGDHAQGSAARAKYSNFNNVDNAFDRLGDYWENKLNKLQVDTPNQGMNTMLNIWTLYQAEINVMFSRFASFIEVGGRTGLGFRDTSQDSMAVQHSNPEKCRSRIVELLQGLTTHGYGLHLFEPSWFNPSEKPDAFKSPTVVPTPNKDDYVHGIEDVCSDDALWLIASIVEYIAETGESSFLDEIVTYADGGEGCVYEHMEKILDFSTQQVGKNGICKGLRADWNDCLNLGGGESAMVSYLHYWALMHFVTLSRFVGRTKEADKYENIAKKVKDITEEVLWDGHWYLRGITARGRKIGSNIDAEGKVHLESNTWAVLSGAAPKDRGIKAMDAVYDYLHTDYGLMLVAPAYGTPDEEIGFVTRVYKGVKENGAIFSHSNPWAWGAEAMLGRGNRAMEFYNALCPYYQNDKIDVRQAEPYSYCQFVMGEPHTAFGRARHPFMTGTGGWSYFAATRYILGIQPQLDGLKIDPCIPAEWDGFSVKRVWRGSQYNIRVENPNGIEKGVKSVYLDGEKVDGIIPTPQTIGSYNIKVVMG